MKISITGSRSISDHQILQFVWKKTPRNWNENLTEVVSGGAAGVDTLAKTFAQTPVWGLKYTEFPACWKEHGKAAGPIRNEEMAKYVDAAIIIWDGDSPGTKNMIKCLEKHKKPYYLLTITEKRKLDYEKADDDYDTIFGGDTDW